MNEKRFTKDDTLMFSAIKDNGKPMKVKEVVDLLNELSENLTGCNKTANNAIETIKALTEENKKLKSELDNIYRLIGQGNWSGLVDLIMEN